MDALSSRLINSKFRIRINRCYLTSLPKLLIEPLGSLLRCNSPFPLLALCLQVMTRNFVFTLICCTMVFVLFTSFTRTFNHVATRQPIFPLYFDLSPPWNFHLGSWNFQLGHVHMGLTLRSWLLFQRISIMLP